MFQGGGTKNIDYSVPVSLGLFPRYASSFHSGVCLYGLNMVTYSYYRRIIADVFYYIFPHYRATNLIETVAV